MELNLNEDIAVCWVRVYKVQKIWASMDCFGLFLL